MARGMSVWIGGLALLVASGTPAAAQERPQHIEMMSSLIGGSYLGVVIDDVSADKAADLKLHDVRGALVTEVEDDSPAAAAGVQKGDVIVRFDGESVRSVAQMQRLVRETPVDRSVSLDVWRKGASKTLEAKLAKRDHLAAAGDVFRRMPPGALAPEGGQPFNFRWRGKDGPPAFHHFFRAQPLKLGISYQPLTDQLAEHFGVDGGVLVSEVHEGGPAARAGMQAGDVIVAFDGNAIDGRRSFSRAVRDAKPGDEVTVSVQRDGARKDLKLTVGGQEPDAGPGDRENEPQRETEHDIDS